MSRQEVEACPECDAAQVIRRSRAGGYRCDRCGAIFEAPVVRESRYDQPANVGGLSALGQACLEWEPDPEDQPFGADDEGGEA